MSKLFFLLFAVLVVLFSALSIINSVDIHQNTERIEFMQRQLDSQGSRIMCQGHVLRRLIKETKKKAIPRKRVHKTLLLSESMSCQDRCWKRCRGDKVCYRRCIGRCR